MSSSFLKEVLVLNKEYLISKIAVPSKGLIPKSGLSKRILVKNIEMESEVIVLDARIIKPLKYNDGSVEIAVAIANSFGRIETRKSEGVNGNLTK